MDGSARDYEDYSTRAWPVVVALGDALAFQAALGAAEKDRRYHALWRRVRDRVDAEASLAWRSPLFQRIAQSSPYSSHSSVTGCSRGSAQSTGMRDLVLRPSARPRETT